MTVTIEMYCIYDKKGKYGYTMYDPYYDAWHSPFYMDSCIESSSLMKSSTEALQILKKLYRENERYRNKIDAKVIVIKKVILTPTKNLDDYDNYECTLQTKELIERQDDKVSLTEFSGNALNHICKNNDFYKYNRDQDFNITEVLKDIPYIEEE